MRIFARQPFGARRAVCKVGSAQSWQKLFCRRSKRIPEFDEFVQPRKNAVFGAEGNDRLVLVHLQVFGRIDKECRAAADFFPQQGDAGASVIKSFDDDIFQFVAQILFDGCLVSFRHFGVVREDANCTKILANAAFVRREELLHGVRGVGTVVQDLRESRVTGTHAGERIAQGIRALRSLLALVAKRGQLSVKVR